MERPNNKIEKYSIVFLYVMYSVGIAGHLSNGLIDLMKLLTPLTLLLTGGLVVYSVLIKDVKIFFWFAASFLFTFIVEVIGVKTGLIFGGYYYGNVLGPKLFSVPLIIGLNWVLIILGARVISRKVTSSIWYSSILTAIFATSFDYVLEPVAMKLGYWIWINGKVPLQNYAAWFVIAFSFSLLYSYIEAKVKSNIPIHYFLIQSVFFITINLFL